MELAVCRVIMVCQAFGVIEVRFVQILLITILKNS